MGASTVNNVLFWYSETVVFNLKKKNEEEEEKKTIRSKSECSADIVVCCSKGSKYGNSSGCLGSIGRCPWTKETKIR